MTSALGNSVAAVTLLFGCIWLTASCRPVTQDDGAVLVAVIEQRLLPLALVEREDRPPQAILVASPTAHPFCPPAERDRAQCLDSQQLSLPELLGQHSVNGRGVLGFSSASTAQLAIALAARNVGGPPIPLRESGRVRVHDLTAPAGEQALEAGLGTIMLSLPAYDTGGDAVVLASYQCGRLCGSTWLFRLSRRWSQWEVIAQSQVSVS
jgi:hypothetical protein